MSQAPLHAYILLVLQNKRIRIIRCHVGKGVIHVTVVALISVDAAQRIYPPSALARVEATMIIGSLAMHEEHDSNLF